MCNYNSQPVNFSALSKPTIIILIQNNIREISFFFSSSNACTETWDVQHYVRYYELYNRQWRWQWQWQWSFMYVFTSLMSVMYVNLALWTSCVRCSSESVKTLGTDEFVIKFYSLSTLFLFVKKRVWHWLAYRMDFKNIVHF